MTDYVAACSAMELKVAGRQFQQVAPRQAGDIKRALNRRTKVKVSTLLSPESQKAMLMVREETIQPRAVAREKTVIPLVPPLPPQRPSSSSQCESDDVSETDHVRFGAMLDRVCTTRLHGDITDKNFAPRQSRKRALRAGDRLHTAMEVVEIVRHDCNDDNTHYDDTDDEQEAIQRTAELSSLERCQAWLELHFDTDDTSSQSSADR